MRNNLLGRLVADYMGIAAATVTIAPTGFSLRRSEDFPRYRAGGRMENYRGTPPLSDAAFAVLQRAVFHAAHALEEYDRADPVDVTDLSAAAARITALTAAGLEGLASPVAARGVTA